MELTVGVKDYLDTLVQDKKNEVVLIYGSFVTKRQTDNSDIDIYVIGDYPQCYIQNTVVDGCQLEISFVNLSYFENGIETSIDQNSAYYFSLLNRNIVLKDSYSLIDSAKEYIDSFKKYEKKKKDITFRQRYLLNEFYNGFNEYNNLYDYFNLIDQIRMTLAHINNLSTLNVGKVYSMYNESERAKDYFLKMPSAKFIKAFDYAVRNPLDNDSIKSLCKFIHYTPCINLRDMESFSCCDSVRVKSILIHMNKMINKATQLLIANNPYKDYVYHVLINHLFRFYEEIHFFVTEELVDCFERAKVETDDYLRIDYLNKLFNLLEGKKRNDYKNYILYLN